MSVNKNVTVPDGSATAVMLPRMTWASLAIAGECALPRATDPYWITERLAPVSL
jgi:hypothetical protein